MKKNSKLAKRLQDFVHNGKDGVKPINLVDVKDQLVSSTTELQFSLFIEDSC